MVRYVGIRRLCRVSSSNMGGHDVRAVRAVAPLNRGSGVTGPFESIVTHHCEDERFAGAGLGLAARQRTNDSGMIRNAWVLDER